jgi:hypothetical protein
MTLAADEFMRRFLLHVLPGGFHRILHFGLIANNGRKVKLALARELLITVPAVAATENNGDDAMDEPVRPAFVCAASGPAFPSLRACTTPALMVYRNANGVPLRAGILPLAEANLCGSPKQT